jgi:hypothetical protein
MRVAQQSPVVIVPHVDRQPAVARLVQPARRGEPVLLRIDPLALWSSAVGRGECVRVEQHARVEDRRVDELPLAGALAVEECLHDRVGRQHPVPRVAERDRVPDRWRAVVRPAGLVLRAGECVAHLVVAGQRGARAVLLEPSRVAVHDPRVQSDGVLVPDAEPLGDAGAHVVVHDVGALDQPVSDLATSRIFEVEGDRLACRGSSRRRWRPSS